MKLAGIDGVIVDWYGLTDYRDYAVLHRNTTRMLQQCERLKMKFVICYEDQTIRVRELRSGRDLCSRPMPGALLGGFDPLAPGFFWVAAQGGYGVQTAPAMGEACAALARGLPLPTHIAREGLTTHDLGPGRLARVNGLATA